MPELGFVGFRLGFANPRFELRQLMGVTPSICPAPQHRFGKSVEIDSKFMP